VPLVVRTWNVFHGNASPPERRGFLREMIGLVTEDGPDLVCLQEVPVWALRRLESWSGMQVVGAVARRPRIASAELGRWMTRAHLGVVRSAVTGQANAILVSREHRLDRPFSSVVSDTGERRLCHGIRLDDDVCVANFHLTGAYAAQQLQRAVDVVQAQELERCIVAGDVNLRPEESDAYDLLRARGFSDGLGGSIDQVLVRGLRATSLVAWPEERRTLSGRVLSDHSPVEVTIE
jgi:endonuclease/exonuclease/phosphatase family metal-dependent hydrolase